MYGTVSLLFHYVQQGRGEGGNLIYSGFGYVPPIWVVFGKKFSKQGSFFQQIFLRHEWFSRNWQKWSKVGSFLPKFIIRVGMTATVGN